jgi:hypothetical protein
MTPADLQKALEANRPKNMKLELDYEHVHAPLAIPVCASVVIGNVLKVIAVGGLDPVTQLAHDLFVEMKGQMSGEDCLAKSREMAAQRAELPQEASVENGNDSQSGIVLP